MFNTQSKKEFLLCSPFLLQVLAFIAFLPGAIMNSHLPSPSGFHEDISDAIKVTKTGAQWIIVVCWMAILVQLLCVLLRFLNLTVVENYIGFFLIAVSVSSSHMCIFFKK